jgi:hypothetical protein
LPAFGIQAYDRGHTRRPTTARHSASRACCTIEV